eukprot:4066057-Heterocapsa_arctica.AAC.1
MSIVKGQMQHNRLTLQDQAFDHYIGLTVYDFFTVSIAVFDLKLRWVNRLPYLIWQDPGTPTSNLLHNAMLMRVNITRHADDREKAKEFVDLYDEAMR